MIYIVQKKHREKYNLDTLLNLITPNCKIVEVDGLTEGAACTALLAKEYINRALVKKPDNIWMLKHLVEIYVKERNYSKAIDVQQKVIRSHAITPSRLLRLLGDQPHLG